MTEISSLFGSDTLLALLVDVTIRGSILLGVVAAIARLLRDRSAAVRHVLWTVGIVGFLALPALSANLPWKLEVLPQRGASTAPEAGFAGPETNAAPASAVERPESADRASGPSGSEALRPSSAPAMSPRGSLAGGEPAGAMRSPGSTAEPPLVGADRGASAERDRTLPAGPSSGPEVAGFGLRSFLLFLWFGGAVLLALRLAVGTIRVNRLVARAKELTDEDSEREVFHLARRLDIGTYVRVVESDELSMPITTGIRRPTIVLPSGFRGWSEDRLRAVILHELAHIHRKDVLSHMVSRVTCALHWFNPLAWHSANRLRTESERACDDLVLRAGTRASAYADHLLSILRSCSGVPSPATAIPMARRTEFEGRLLAILEPDARRAAAGRTTIALVAVAVALIAVPLAALAPAGPGDDPTVALHDEDRAGDEGSERSEPGEASRPIIDRRTADDADGGRDGHASDLSERSDRAGAADSDAERDREESVSGLEKDGGLSALLEGVARGAVGAIASLIEETTVAQDTQESVKLRLVQALSDVLIDDGDAATRRAAAHALGETEDPRAVEALSRALANDPDASVRLMAAWALGEIESAAGIPALGRAAQRDASADVRRMAVWALGEIEHPDAIPVLSEIATSADSPELRHRAVWGLGEIEHADAVPALSRIATSNAPVQTRRLAAWGLGEIEDRSAIPALGRLVRDSDHDVRATAIWALGEIEHPDAVEHLAAATTDADPSIRRRALHALGEIESERGVPAVARALSDGDPAIRALAIWALGEIESPQGVSHLTPLLRSGDAAQRRRVAWALGEIESELAVDALAPLVRDADVSVRRAVVWALCQIESPRSVPALGQALDDEDPAVRFLALQGLSHIETEASVEQILRVLETGDSELRRAATTALGGGDYHYDFDWDFDEDFEFVFDNFDWKGWSDAWDEWSREPDHHVDGDEF